jgi:endonuclease YncB( thermonuclease family)
MMKAVRCLFAALMVVLPITAAHADVVQDRAAQVISGDEIKLDDGKILKLAGIHAPFDATKKLADAAREKLRDMAEEKTLAVENASTDRYGRMAAEAYVSGAKKTGLQDEMLKAGMVFVYAPDGDAPRLSEWPKVEAAARAAKRGIWADAFYADTDATDADRKYGQFAFITGKALKAERVKNMVYLNFGDDWREDFTVAIAAHDLRAFRRANIDPLDYGGKVLRVRGWVRHEHRPMIYATNAEQIEVLAGR